MRRFSIRDLFWLTLVVAMGVGWWLDRERQEDEQERQRATAASAVVAAQVEKTRWRALAGLLAEELESIGYTVDTAEGYGSLRRPGTSHSVILRETYIRHADGTLYRVKH